jgi:alkylhydroperoxidase/carboxymuconolactone decarboxylase family protein YurZ
MPADLDQVRAEAEALVVDAPDGPDLDAQTAVLVDYAVAAAATALDAPALRAATAAALDAGADAEVLVEVLLLVSALGMHTLHEGIIELRRHVALPDGDPGELRRRHEGRTHYWTRFETELPGFLDGLARWSPQGYTAFLAYCATPVKTGRLGKLQRELIWLAIDATPTHRYVPGLRFHVGCAVRLGASRAQVFETLSRAARAPKHSGVATHVASDTRP